MCLTLEVTGLPEAGPVDRRVRAHFSEQPHLNGESMWAIELEGDQLGDFCRDHRH